MLTIAAVLAARALRKAKAFSPLGQGSSRGENRQLFGGVWAGSGKLKRIAAKVGTRFA